MKSDATEPHNNLDEDDDESVSDGDTDLDGPPRLRKGETVLQARTARILLVLEQCHDSFNHQVIKVRNICYCFILTALNLNANDSHN